MNEVAKTILAQLGGRRFMVMTGAKDLVYGANLLRFRVGRNAKGVTKVQVTLTPEDLYDVTFFKGAGVNVREVAKVEGIFAESLQETFTRYTGLDTHL